MGSKKLQTGCKFRTLQRALNIGRWAASKVSIFFLKFKDWDPNHPQTLRGSFSAVSTATIATKYSFFQVFRDLQDFHTFAPLRSQKFSEKPSKFLLEFFRFFRVFRWKFAIFLRNFDEILPEFHRNCLEMAKKLTLLKDWGKPKRLIFLKDWKKQKDWEKIKDWERLAAFLAAQPNKI